jgi:hypothetical protein
MLRMKGSCLAGSRIYLAETHCRPFNFEVLDYYIQKKSTLSSLGLLLGTSCSYLFNLFRSPVITFAPPCLKFGSSYFCPHSALVCFTWEHRVYLYFAWFSEKSLRSSRYSVVTLRVLVVVHRLFGTSILPIHKNQTVQEGIRGFSEDFAFPTSTSGHQCSIVFFIYTFLSSERQTDESWEPS